MWHSSELDKLAPDFAALQSELEPVGKAANNPFFKSKYAPLPHVAEALKPVLARHNLSLSALPAIIEGPEGPTNGLRFVLLHASGQYLSGEWMLTPTQATPQAEGADTTYKRRFGIQSITGMVADEDDDGHAASAPPPRQKTQLSPPPPQQTDADRKRDELKALAKERGWSLTDVARVYGGNLKTATADEIEAFIVSLEAGVVTV